MKNLLELFKNFIFVWGACPVETPIKRTNRVISDNATYGKDTIERIDEMLAEIEKDLENWIAESGEGEK